MTTDATDRVEPDAIATDTTATDAIATDAIAAELLDALDRNVQIRPITDRFPAFDNAAAYAVNAEILRRRVARGESRSAARSASPIGRSGPSTASTSRCGPTSTTRP